DDVPHGVASGHPTELHRAALGSGPAALGAGDVASQRGAEIPAHVPAAREHIQRIAACPEADILSGEAGRTASGGCQEGEENCRKRSGHDGSPLAGDPSTPRVCDTLPLVARLSGYWPAPWLCVPISRWVCLVGKGSRPLRLHDRTATLVPG